METPTIEGPLRIVQDASRTLSNTISITKAYVVILLTIAITLTIPLLATVEFCRNDGYMPASLSNIISSPNAACPSVIVWFTAYTSRYLMSRGLVTQLLDWKIATYAYMTYLASCVSFVVFMVFPIQDGYFDSKLVHNVSISIFVLSIVLHHALIDYGAFAYSDRPLPVSFCASVSLTMTSLLSTVACVCALAFVQVDSAERYDKITFYSVDIGGSEWLRQNAFLLSELVLFSAIAVNVAVTHSMQVSIDKDRYVCRRRRVEFASA